MKQNNELAKSLLSCYPFAFLLFFDYCMKRYRMPASEYQMMFHMMVTALIVVCAILFYAGRLKKDFDLLRISLACLCMYCVGFACFILPKTLGLWGIYVHETWTIIDLYFKLGFPATIVFTVLTFRLILGEIHKENDA